MEKVSVAVINYNGEQYLQECLSSIQASDYPIEEIILVDNNSQDDSLKFVRENFPQVKIISLQKNLGPGAARNIALKKACFNYVLLVDPDGVMEPSAVRHLVAALKLSPQAAAAHPRVLFYNQRERIQYDGSYIHYLGVAVQRHRNEQLSDHPPGDPEPVDCLGGIPLVKKDIALSIGGYDEAYFYGFEDADFIYRLTMADYTCYNVPLAVVYHKEGTSSLSMREGKQYQPQRAFMVVRNRWFFILKMYEWRSIILLAPVFLLYEFITCVYLLIKGSFIEHIKGLWAVALSLRKIMAKRKVIQHIRVKRDRDLLGVGDLTFAVGVVKPGIQEHVKRLMDSLFKFYWKIIFHFI
jgi:hypothetical protein